MRKQIFLLIFLFGSALMAFSQAKSEPKWAIYNSPDGLYSVLLPTKPSLKQQEAKDADGKPLEQYLASAHEGNATLMVGYFDYYAPATFSFDRARDGLLNNIAGTLVSEDPTKLGEYPGRFVVADANGDGIDFRVYVRFYDAGGRVYVLQYIVPKSDDGPLHKPKMAKYFDSFKITRKN